MLTNHPYLYISGRKGKVFNMYKFWEWIILGAYQAGVCVLVAFYVNTSSPSYENGQMDGFWMSGIIVYSSVILISNLKVIMFSFTKSILLYMTVGISIGVFLVILVILSNWF